MRCLFFFLGCLLFPTFGFAQSGEFEIIQVDPAASTFTVEANKQLHTYRVRPGVEVTINGVSASFAKLEVGMKVKVTSADPGVATKLVANGLQTAKPAPKGRAPAGAAREPVAPAGAPAKQADAEIVANSVDGFSLGELKKGTKLSIQYKSGIWKSWGRIATESPDSEKTPPGDTCRVAISLPAHNGKPGKALAVVPGETGKRPFIFEVPLDFPDLVLRINDKEGEFDGNPGKVEYTVSIFPPAK
jgi:hypothetical protein